jgi:hypothetical protein
MLQGMPGGHLPAGTAVPALIPGAPPGVGSHTGIVCFRLAEIDPDIAIVPNEGPAALLAGSCLERDARQQASLWGLPPVEELTVTQVVRATELRDGDRQLAARAMAGQDAGFCHS